jgi:hypothetical protein
MGQLPLLLRANLYRLKRDYGSPLDIYKCLNAETDTQTGARVITVQVAHIPLAVCLPTTQRRKEALRGKKEGAYDVCVREFIVPRADAGDLTTLTDDDWVVAGGRRFQVAAVEDYGVIGAWLITGRELVGEVPQQIVEIKAESAVGAKSYGE